MPEVWPPQLPSYAMAQSYAQDLGDGRINSNTDTGPGKIRRRTTMDPDIVQAQMVMDGYLVPTFEDFFKTVTMSGSLPFIFPNQRIKTRGMLVRFQKQQKPRIESFAQDSDWWRVSFSLEVLDGAYTEFGVQPDPFTFSDVNNAIPGQVYYSNAVTMSGFIDALNASVVGGEMSINGGAYVTADTQVVAGDVIVVRGTAVSYADGVKSVLLQVGTMSDLFEIRTAVADYVPAPFTLNDVVNADLGGTYVSNSITVSDTTAATNIVISGGEYSINNGPYATVDGTVQPGDTVRIRGTASTTYATDVNILVTIGTVGDTWTIRTKDAPPAADTTPDPFTFGSQSGLTPGVTYTSNAISVAGINAPASIAVAGGEISINGLAWTSGSGTVILGDQVRARGMASSLSGGQTVVRVTIGGVSGDFILNTVQAQIDTVPDQFSFTPLTNTALSTQVQSNQITVTGINAQSAISVSNGEYQVNGGLWISTQTTVKAGDTVRVRHITSASYQAQVNTVLNIGGVSATFTSTTAALNTTPTQFIFTDVVNADLNAFYISNTITVSGINGPSTMTVSGGDYSKNGAGYTAIATTVNAGDTVNVRVQAASTYGTTLTGFLTIGGVTDGYDVKTLPQVDFVLTATEAPANQSDVDVGTILDTTPTS